MKTMTIAAARRRWPKESLLRVIGKNNIAGKMR